MYFYIGNALLLLLLSLSVQGHT